MPNSTPDAMRTFRHDRGARRSHAVWTTFPLAVLVTALITFGCGAGNEPARSEVAAAASGQVRIASASDLKFALDDVIAAFHKANPELRVTPTYGSSGNFYSQLTHEAPFDVYLSADIEYPRKLVAANLADDEFLYGVGRIVVWVPRSSPLDVEKLGIEALADPSVKKIAIANPAHAPYGRAAEAAMKKLGVYEAVQDRLVLGENIAQTAQFVESGAAEIGVIALSLALAPRLRENGRYWLVPLDAYPKLEQGGVILKRADDRGAAEAFKAFLIGDQGRAILDRYGFELPGA